MHDRALTPLACSTLAYAESPFEEALAGIAEAGYRYVEIAAMPGYCDHLVRSDETEAQTATRVERTAREVGLEVISLSAHIDLAPAPPGHLPAFAPDRALDLLLARVRIGAELGAWVINTQGANVGSTKDEEEFLDRLEVVAEESDRLGVTLALEVADGLTASAAAIRALMPRLRGAPVRINFDTGNLPFYSGLDPVTEFEPIHEHVAHVHVKDHRGGIGDYDFPAIGEGELDLPAFFALARRVGYRGPFSAEIEFQHPTARPSDEVITAAALASRLAMQTFLEAA